ncbi:hypothetical protein G7K_4562-t1 [Saitoella complicata NRRL Y-17804]|uniref:Uncharacterized protein n=1 Tax=Saitoella complicata (strain BCRC 22490 / CBS 7301 / JCM 7358 / NBRC 10748 / NRRL Y-17804) TaxID=698492 RepID=A0A0E9NKP0_SAICN|nr:hypothetical protein G7K_4562-t1 [Saitoella complicata NRRL Y-17804]
MDVAVDIAVERRMERRWGRAGRGGGRAPRRYPKSLILRPGLFTPWAVHGRFLSSRSRTRYSVFEMNLPYPTYAVTVSSPKDGIPKSSYI